MKKYAYLILIFAICHSAKAVLSVSISYGTCNTSNSISMTASGSGGTSPYSYLWSTGQVSAAINGQGNQNYTVTVTDAVSSTATATYTALSMTATIPVAVKCHISTPGAAGSTLGTIAISASGGASPYTYSSDGITYTSTTNYSSLAPAIYPFWVKDNNSCIVRIEQNLAATTPVVVKQTGNASTTISLNITGGAGAPNKSQWATTYGGSYTAFSSTNPITGLTTKTIYWIKAEDRNLCVTPPIQMYTSPTPTTMLIHHFFW